MKTKLITTAVIFLVWPCFAEAQTWETEWEKQVQISNVDRFSDVIEDKNEGFTVLGCTFPQGKKDQDLWLVRMDNKGEIIWEKTFGTVQHDLPARLIQLSDCSYILTGKTVKPDNSFRALMLKVDKDGNEIWQKELGDANSCCFDDVIPREDGGFIVAGNTSTPGSQKNIWLVRFNPDGEIVWEKTFGDGKMAGAKSLKSLPDEGFALAGEIAKENSADTDIWLFRFNASDEQIWNKQIDAPGKSEWPECLCCSADNNLLVAGWTGTCMNDINSENPIFDYNFFLAKISPEGKVVWTQSIDSEGSEGGNAVAVRPDGKILLAGKKETSFLGRIGPWLLLADENGKVISETVLPFRFAKDQAAKIINVSDGGFVVVGPGALEPNVTRSEAWIKKYKAF